MRAEAQASEVRSQGEDWGGPREHSLKGASVPQLAGRESRKMSGPAKETRDGCFGVHGERGFRALPKQAPEMGVSHGYQRGLERQEGNANAAAGVTKNPVRKHRSLSTPALLGAFAACYCQSPMIKGQLPRENTWHASGCCSVKSASAATGSCLIPYPSLPQT